MTLPNYWAEPSFAVAEVAELIGTPEVTLRSYLARCPEGDFLGKRDTSRRVHLSCRDAFFYRTVSDLSDFGVPVRTAMHVAARLSSQDSLPAKEYLVVRMEGSGAAHFTHSDDRPTDGEPALVLPVHSMARVLIELAADVYAKESS